MQLRPLYTVRFVYPDGWSVELKGPGGVEEQHYYFAEGRCEGAIAGTFRAGNHPRRRADHSYAMNMQGFIQTDDGAVIMVDYQGFGRAYPPGRRQVVGAAWQGPSPPGNLYNTFSVHGPFAAAGGVNSKTVPQPVLPNRRQPPFPPELVVP